MPTTDTNARQHKVLLITLPYMVSRKEAKNSKIRSFEAFPYGLLSVASYIKRKSVLAPEIKIIDCNVYSQDEYRAIIHDTLNDFEPSIVGLSMMFDNSYDFVRDVAQTVKAWDPDALVVLGGAAASFSYDEIINEQESVDAVCYAEGEEPFLRLVDAPDRKAVLATDPSWITKRTLAEGKKPVASFIEDLSEVIHIDYSLVDNSSYKMKEAFSPFIRTDVADKRQYFLVSSRGCPYRCVFCSNAAIHGKKIRYADVENTIAHVRHLVSEYGMNVLTIYDDQLLTNLKRAKELFRQLAQFKLRIECPNGLSVAFIDDEIAGLMREAGVDTVALAIESGSEFMIRQVIHKPLKLEMVKPVIQILRKYDFFIEGFFVNGLPGELEEHRQETANFIKDVELDWSGFSLAAPFRGSPLYDICVTNGYIDKNTKIGEVMLDKYMIQVPGTDPAEITRQTYLMNLDVNFVNNYRLKAGDYKVAANCFRDVIRRYENHAFAHYFLAKAEQGLGESPDSVARHLARFREITEQDDTWKEYAEFFGLE